MRSKILFSLFFVFLFSFSLVSAANPSEVIINEIAWMGGISSANDEWIELYNNTESPINLEEWLLKADDGTPEINLTGTISAKGFYLLERTDDETVPEVPANLIYKGALENDGENLKLYDNFVNLIDEVNCQNGWFSGDNKTKQTMERMNPAISGNNTSNWQTSKNPGGTPKSKNSLFPLQQSREVTEETKQEIQEESEPKVYPLNIFINEILPSPEGADSENEWLELFNENDFEVELSGWKIQDTIGSITTYTFPEGTKIGPKDFLVLSRPTTKITLNNSNEGLLLIKPDGDILDKVTYEKAPRGQSYNRTESGWAWSTILTQGAANIISVPQPQKEKTQGEKPKTELPKDESAADSKTKKVIAKIGENLPKSPNSLIILLIALGIAISSAIVVLIIKKKTETEE